MTTKEAVQNGIDLLNVENPGWSDYIDIETLDMRYTNKCVLAQVYNHISKYAYLDGLDILGLTESESHKYGFNLDMGSNYYALTTEWKSAISKMRNLVPMA